MERKNIFRQLLEKFIDIREAGVLMPLILAIILFSANSDKFLTMSNMTNVIRTALHSTVVSIRQAFPDHRRQLGYFGRCVLRRRCCSRSTHELLRFSDLACGACLPCDRRNLRHVQRISRAEDQTSSVHRHDGNHVCGARPLHGLYQRRFGLSASGSVSRDRPGGHPIGNYELPFVIVVAILMAIVAGFILRYTAYGRKLYAAGGNGEAARLAGIPTVRVRFSAFVLLGVLSALAGVLMTSRVGSAQPNIGSGFEMTVSLPPASSVESAWKAARAPYWVSSWAASSWL